MKRTLAILLAALISVSVFAACGDETGSRRNRDKNNTKDKDKTSVSDVFDMDEDDINNDSFENNPLDDAEDYEKQPAEDIVSIYMENADIWQREMEYAMGGSILFLDLDLDSSPELVTTTIQGSGLFSSNRYYRINPTTKAVEELTCEFGIAYDGDIFSQGYPKLYTNPANGDVFYMLSDTMRAGAGAYSRAEGIISLGNNGEIKSETLWGYDYSDGKFSASGQEEYTYRVHSNGTYETVDKETYEKAIEDFDKTYTNVPLELESIDLAEFNEASESAQYELLLDCYNALK